MKKDNKKHRRHKLSNVLKKWSDKIFTQDVETALSISMYTVNGHLISCITPLHDKKKQDTEK